MSSPGAVEVAAGSEAQADPAKLKLKPKKSDSKKKKEKKEKKAKAKAKAARKKKFASGAAASHKRIQKELAEISINPPASCSAGPKGEDLMEWVSSRAATRIAHGPRVSPPPRPPLAQKLSAPATRVTPTRWRRSWDPTARRTRAACSTWTSSSRATTRSSRRR